jgi:hypothetical protein
MKRRFKKAIVSTATTTMAIAGVAAIGVSLTQCAKDDPTPANDY